MNLKKAYNHFLSISFLVTGLFVLYCYLVAIIPFDILRVNTEPLPVLNEDRTVKRGDTLKLYYDYCKYFAFTATIKTVIEDGVIWELPQTKSNFETGCHTRTLEIKIPEEVPSGEKIRLTRTISYQVSPFTTKDEFLISEFFIVE